MRQVRYHKCHSHITESNCQCIFWGNHASPKFRLKEWFQIQVCLASAFGRSDSDNYNSCYIFGLANSYRKCVWWVHTDDRFRMCSNIIIWMHSSYFTPVSVQTTLTEAKICFFSKTPGKQKLHDCSSLELMIKYIYQTLIFRRVPCYITFTCQKVFFSCFCCFWWE